MGLAGLRVVFDFADRGGAIHLQAGTQIETSDTPRRKRPLVPGKSHQISAQFGEVEVEPSRDLGGVNQDARLVLVSQPNHIVDRQQVSRDVAGRCDGNQLYPALL